MLHRSSGVYAVLISLQFLYHGAAHTETLSGSNCAGQANIYIRITLFFDKVTRGKVGTSAPFGLIGTVDREICVRKEIFQLFPHPTDGGSFKYKRKYSYLRS
jgi:hypothetical protein